MIDTINKKEVYADDIHYFFMQEKQHPLKLDDTKFFIKIFDAERKGFLDIHK